MDCNRRVQEQTLSLRLRRICFAHAGTCQKDATQGHFFWFINLLVDIEANQLDEWNTFQNKRLKFTFDKYVDFFLTPFGRFGKIEMRVF